MCQGNCAGILTLHCRQPQGFHSGWRASKCWPKIWMEHWKKRCTLIYHHRTLEPRVTLLCDQGSTDKIWCGDNSNQTTLETNEFNGSSYKLIEWTLSQFKESVASYYVLKPNVLQKKKMRNYTFCRTMLKYLYIMQSQSTDL